MMKKGFTLAEVLITLSIIGVVAAVTLPSLMANTAEQQARTTLKKMVNSFSQAAEISETAAGFNYGGVISASGVTADSKIDEANNLSLLRLFLDRLKVDRSHSYTAGVTNDIAAANKALYFHDGTAIYFADSAPSVKARSLAGDGVSNGIFVLFDTNGSKGPNQVSNCTGAAISAWSADDKSSCAKKGNRYIKDIYMMNLRDTYVYPLGAASTWMLNDAQSFNAGAENEATHL